MAATIKDIAKITGLGYATISAYINGITVRPKNKDAIEDAIKKLGYVRNEYARGLKTHRTMTIGVLIPELNNVFSTTIISEMEDILRKNGYGILVSDCRSDAKTEIESLKFLMSKMIDGLIIMPINTDGKILESVILKNLPVVVIDRLTDNTDVSSVVINNREVSKSAVSKLVENGHKRIALITGDSSIYTANQRRLGYQDATTEKFLFDDSLIFDGNLTIEGGYLAMKSIIENKTDVTALFVTNYEMTVGAIIAINEFGKKIPDDFSFVGFDNQELSKVFSPKLATVNQPLKEIGKQSANQIMNLINKGEKQTFTLSALFEEGGSIKSI